MHGKYLRAYALAIFSGSMNQAITRTRRPHRQTLRTGAALCALTLLAPACAAGDSGMERYATRVASTGDSALAVLARYASSDSAAPIVWDAGSAARIERLATAFAGVLRPDTTVLEHRQMLEGLDTLVVVLRTVRKYEERCGTSPDITCRGTSDFARFRASLRRGEALYLAGRARLDSVLATFDVRLPAPPPGLDARRSQRLVR